MHPLPLYIPVVFLLTTFLAVYIFYKATQESAAAVLIILVWLTLQAFMALYGFYTHTQSLPPRFILLPLPPLILIIALFLSRRGRAFIDGLDVKLLVLLHVVRIPVELVLYWLSEQGVVPKLITFEGKNFDIFSGLTAPLIYYFTFVRPVLGKGVLIAWNIVCLLLLVNVVTHAVLSLPAPFQKFAFEQPNVAVLYFPYIWLPCCVVPLVLFSHLVVLRRCFTKD